ncbi:MAG: exodeoxyribonuclease VII small subunit [Rikenellaceae bacterium]
MEQKRLSYDEATAEIEAIIAKFRSNEVTIDELSAEVKRATELITLCREKLTTAETELKRILE